MGGKKYNVIFDDPDVNINDTPLEIDITEM